MIVTCPNMPNALPEKGNQLLCLCRRCSEVELQHGMISVENRLLRFFPIFQAQDTAELRVQGKENLDICFKLQWALPPVLGLKGQSQ